MSWTTNHDVSLEGLRRVQGSLTVDLIMVRREDFKFCTPEETAAQIASRNVESFSYFPVIDGQRVLGLYNAERWFNSDAPDTAIADDFQRLSEDIVIGADTSIFDFVMQADTHPTNLVVSGSEIAGLVSLSDLQKLPVRASLFALITSLEMAMALAIERQWPEPKVWMDMLSEERRTNLLKAIEAAKARDGFVSEIALTQLSDKTDIISKSRLLGQSRTQSENNFKPIRDLRDNIAHANHYATTPKSAKAVCQAVRSIYDIKAELLKVIETIDK